VSSKRILVIEDEFLIGLEMHSLLTEAGFGVVGPAATVPAALKHISEGNFDSGRPCLSKGKAESQAAQECKWPGVLPGFVPPASNQRDQREHGRSIRFKRKFVGPDKLTR
jgi:hypothetical protein